MNVSVTEAVKQLQDLVRRAEAGEEVVLTEDGRAAVKLVAVERRPWREMTPDEREVILRRAQERARATRIAGPGAAESADFLYGPDGLPE